MERDYWMTASEAKEYGLIDEIVSSPVDKSDQKSKKSLPKSR